MTEEPEEEASTPKLIDGSSAQGSGVLVPQTQDGEYERTTRFTYGALPTCECLPQFTLIRYIICAPLLLKRYIVAYLECLEVRYMLSQRVSMLFPYENGSASIKTFLNIFFYLKKK